MGWVRNSVHGYRTIDENIRGHADCRIIVMRNGEGMVFINMLTNGINEGLPDVPGVVDEFASKSESDKSFMIFVMVKLTSH